MPSDPKTHSAQQKERGQRSRKDNGQELSRCFAAATAATRARENDDVRTAADVSNEAERAGESIDRDIAAISRPS